MELVGCEGVEARSHEDLASLVVHNMENSLKEMKKAKKDLEEQIKQARLAELDDIISEKGLTFEEVKKMLGCEE